MDDLLNGMLSSNISERSNAVEKLRSRLKTGKPLQEKPDNIVKVISNTISILRDANAKIVLQCLDCLQKFMELHPKSFPPLINMTFDMLMSKYGDGKIGIRNKATEVMVELIGMTDLAAGYDRLFGLLSIANKSIRVKEQIILTFLLLHSTYGEEVLNIPNLLKKLSTLLNDNTASVRSLAVDALATLHVYMGDEMLEQLEAQGVRTDRIVSIQDAVVSESYVGALEPVRDVAVALLRNGRLGRD